MAQWTTLKLDLENNTIKSGILCLKYMGQILNEMLWNFDFLVGVQKGTRKT
jgi:hypothetical protein